MEDTLVETESLTWDAKLEKAKNLIKNLRNQPIGFDKHLRDTFYSEIDQPTFPENIDQLINTNLNYKDKLKLKNLSLACQK